MNVKITQQWKKGIFALVPQTSFRGKETISGVAKVSFFLTLRLTKKEGLGEANERW